MIQEILRSYSLSLSFLEQLVADVPDDLMSAQQAGVVNHPAWVIGHLIHSAQAIGNEMELVSWLPENWERQFRTGSVPTAERQAYPSKQSLLGTLRDAEQRVKNQLLAIGENALTGPLPDVRYRETFPTIGHAVLHILTAHAASHIGQVTVWRRVMGFGPLSNRFI